MQVVCAQCHAVCDVDERAGSTTTLQRCSACGVLLPLSPSPPGHEAQWFVLLPTGQSGPHNVAQMAQLFDQLSVDWSSLIWRHGLKDWRPARRDPALVTGVASARGSGAFGDTQRVSPHSLPPATADTRVTPPPAGREAQLAEAAEPTAVWSEQQGEAATHVVARGQAAGPRDALRSAPRWTASEIAADITHPQPVRQRRSSPSSWLPSAQSMLIVALVAFAFGVLAAALWGRVLSRSAQRASTVVVRPSSAQTPVVPSVPHSPVPSTAPLVARSEPLVLPAPLHDLPSEATLRSEMRRVSADVRRCLDDPSRGVDAEVIFEGVTGRASEVRVRSPGLTPGRTECVTQVVRQVQVEPFGRATFRYVQRFAY